MAGSGHPGHVARRGAARDRTACRAGDAGLMVVAGRSSRASPRLDASWRRARRHYRHRPRHRAHRRCLARGGGLRWSRRSRCGAAEPRNIAGSSSIAVRSASRVCGAPDGDEERTAYLRIRIVAFAAAGFAPGVMGREPARESIALGVFTELQAGSYVRTRYLCDLTGDGSVLKYSAWRRFRVVTPNHSGPCHHRRRVKSLPTDGGL